MHRVEYLIWLRSIGLSSWGKLLPAIEYFSSPEEIYNAKRSDYEECGMFTEKEIEALSLKDTSFVEKEVAGCNRERCYLVDYFSKFYPESLKSIPEPPLLLYVKGDREILSQKSVTIAGSRTSDSYGIDVAQSIASSVVSKGYNVVSGMAHGIDSSSALGALNSRGKVLGVLCSGLDVDYPSSSKPLKEKILSGGGALISEFPLGWEAKGNFFHIRNRIMAALSDATVIVQAGEKSGALITAKKALEYKKELWAVPNEITSPLASGVNSLIENGAKILLDIPSFKEKLLLSKMDEKDSLGEIKEENIKRKPSGKKAVSRGNTESDNMIDILKYFNDGEKTAEEIANLSGKSLKWVNSTLIILEVSGKIKGIPGGKYSLV